MQNVTTDNNPRVENLSTEQFAAKMGISRTTVFALIKAGHLLPGRHFFMIGTTRRFPWGPELLQRLLDDSLDNAPVLEVKKDILEELQPPLPSSSKKGTQINLDY
jgi:predicted DNA-binding transcriptional regulator AlpA